MLCALASSINSLGAFGIDACLTEILKWWTNVEHPKGLREAVRQYSSLLSPGDSSTLSSEDSSALPPGNPVRSTHGHSARSIAWALSTKKQAKLGEAEKMFQRALQGYEKAPGAESVTTYIPALNTTIILASFLPAKTR